MYVCAMKNVKPKKLMPTFYSVKPNLLKYLLLILFLSVLQNSYSAPPVKKKYLFPIIASINVSFLLRVFTESIIGATVSGLLGFIGFAGRYFKSLAFV